MTRTMRLLLFAVVAAAFFCKPGRATTYTAASCSESDVQSAINSEKASPADGDIISIPSGSCTWAASSGINVTFTTSVTIQGAGAVYATTGGVGTAGSDATVIIDNITNNNGVMNISMAQGKTLIFTGIAMMENASSVSEYNGMVAIYGGTTSQVRLHHCHFYLDKQTTDMRLGGAITGVVDHVYFETASGLLTTDIAVHNGNGWNGDSGGYSDGSWADTDHFGTNRFMFFEDDRFNNGDIGDAFEGARYVLRHNTVTGDGNSSLQMYTHGLTNQRLRATRAAEVYQNNFTAPFQIGNPVYSFNSGALLFWGNTVSGFKGAVQISYTRASNGTYNYGTPPSGWGNCGTGSPSGATNWDGNLDSTGYPCMDQAGRGAGNLLSGYFPTVCDQTTGCTTYTGTWPHQVLDPAYVWANTYANAYASYPLVVGSGVNADNRDYYQQFGTLAESGSWDGTRGVNQSASAPSGNCTAGTDPKTGATGPGVGWWDTSNNTLYVCNPTNTWTAYYTPYTYPHPLTAGTGIAPAPPTNLTGAVQ